MADEIRIMIVEDRDEVREGLCMLINGSAGYRCVAACGSAEEALEALKGELPEVILMDIHLPGMQGPDCVVRVKERFPGIQVMMLTVFEDSDEIFRSLEAGATGYLLKKTPPAKLLEAIRELVDGGSPMSSEIARKVVRVFNQSPKDKFAEADLSPRESEILSFLARGFLYKEIADALCINIETVRSHIHKIYRKLHIHTRSELLLRYFGR